MPKLGSFGHGHPVVMFRHSPNSTIGSWCQLDGNVPSLPNSTMGSWSQLDGNVQSRSKLYHGAWEEDGVAGSCAISARWTRHGGSTGGRRRRSGARRRLHVGPPLATLQKRKNKDCQMFFQESKI